jgi:hypothetical protein
MYGYVLLMRILTSRRITSHLATTAASLDLQVRLEQLMPEEEYTRVCLMQPFVLEMMCWRSTMMVLILSMARKAVRSLSLWEVSRRLAASRRIALKAEMRVNAHI